RRIRADLDRSPIFNGVRQHDQSCLFRRTLGSDVHNHAVVGEGDRHGRFDYSHHCNHDASPHDRAAAGAGAAAFLTTSMMGAGLLFSILLVSRRQHQIRVILLLVLVAVVVAVPSCGGGSSTPAPPPPLPANSGTATGTYNMTVTATSGSTVSRTGFTLIVK